MLTEVFRKEALQSLAKYVRECVLVEGRHVNNGDIRRYFVKSEFVIGEPCSTQLGYDRSLNRVRIAETGAYVLH